MCKSTAALAFLLLLVPDAYSSPEAESKQEMIQDRDSSGFPSALANVLRQVSRDGKNAAKPAVEELVLQDPQDRDLWAVLYALYWHDPPRSVELSAAADAAGEEVLALYQQVFDPDIYEEREGEQLVDGIRRRIDDLPDSLRSRPLVRSVACYLSSGVAPDQARSDCQAAALDAPDMLSTIRGTAILQERLGNTVALRGLVHRLLVMYNADLPSSMHFWDSRPRCSAAWKHLWPFINLDFQHPLRRRALRALLSVENPPTVSSALELLEQLLPEDHWWRRELGAIVENLGSIDGARGGVQQWLQRVSDAALTSARDDGGSFLAKVARARSDFLLNGGDAAAARQILERAQAVVRNTYKPELLRRLASMDARNAPNLLAEASLLEHPFFGTIPTPNESVVPRKGDVQRTIALAHPAPMHGLVDFEGQAVSPDGPHVLVFWRGRCHWTKVLHQDLVERNRGREVPEVYWVNYDGSSSFEDVALDATRLGLPSEAILLSRPSDAQDKPLHTDFGVTVSPYLIAVSKSGWVVWEHRGVRPGGDTALEILRLLEYLNEAD